ncbi:MAG TPA: endonuclease/exonuclease/phosphatase family protein [Kofleriaceae bacterium]|nr:endonuclease/exonuclease/phosphatase family protein [Kofleriaceae bacterium]
MTFNVLLGGQDRFDAIRAIMAAVRPDILVLEECLGWEDGERLAAVAEAIGVPADEHHAVLGTANQRPSGRRHHVALVSRPPIARSQVHAPSEVAHCLLEAEVDVDGTPLTVIGAHLHANDEDSRLVEVEALLGIAPPDAVRAGEWVLCGDLNSLTRHDPYPPDLDQHLARAGVHKYGHPPRFEVMDRLFAAGWIDALRERPRDGRWVTARRARGDEGVSVDTRTDYVLLSPAPAARLVAADVIEVGGASDHHAVMAELQ